MVQSSGMVIALTAVFTFLELLFVALRITTRIVRKSGLGVDDWLVIAAGILFVPLIAIPLIIQCALGNGGNHQPTYPNGFPMPPNPTSSYYFSVTSLIIQSCHVIPLGLTKAGIIFFYRRIFRGAVFNAITISALVLVAMWTVSFFFALLLMCLPIEGLVTKGFLGATCVNRLAIYDALSISDFTIDFAIIAMPLPFVWRLQMATRLKLGVSAVFLLGLLTTAIGILRMAIFIREEELSPQQLADYTYSNEPSIYFTMIEASLAIVSACLLTMRPLVENLSPMKVVRFLRSALSSSPTSRSDEHPLKHLPTDDSSRHSTSHVYDVEHGRARLVSKAHGAELWADDDSDLPTDGIRVEKRMETTSHGI